MNINSTLRTGVLLSITATALSGTFTLADELAGMEPSPTPAAIVLAKASPKPNNANQPTTGQEAINAALAAALQGVMADNKLELDMRLSGHKSVFLAAGL